MTRIAVVNPSHCSSCFSGAAARENEEPRRFVDFEAYWDGPTIPGQPMISIDDLVICENCLREAAALLDIGEERKDAERLAGLLENANHDIAAKDRMIQRCLMTIDELVQNPIKRRQGAASYVTLSDEISHELEQRRAKRGKVSRKIKEGQAKAKA